jgi:hypothetical protein
VIGSTIADWHGRLQPRLALQEKLSVRLLSSGAIFRLNLLRPIFESYPQSFATSRTLRSAWMAPLQALVPEGISVAGGSRHCRELGVRGIALFALFAHFRTCERRPRPFPAGDSAFSLLIRKGIGSPRGRFPISVSTGTPLLIGRPPSSGCSCGDTNRAPGSLAPVSGSQFATSGAWTSAFGTSGASPFSATSIDVVFGSNSRSAKSRIRQ